MNQAKLVIVGASGQLGSEIKQRYPQARALNSSQLDITDQSQVEAFDWSRYDVIINAAAYTDVDGAETDDGRYGAWMVNSQGVKNLAKIATKHDMTLVHISTEYVFDGREEEHVESEPVSPIGVYGASKASGDVAASLVAKHYILRTSWVVGSGKNFVRTMVNLGEKGIEPIVVSDQIGRPTFTSELARAIDFLLSNRPEYGLYNFTNDGESVSWAGLARKVFAIKGYSFKVYDTSTEQYFKSKPNAAPRPLNSRLDLTKIKQAGFVPADWNQVLKDYLS